MREVLGVASHEERRVETISFFGGGIQRRRGADVFTEGGHHVMSYRPLFCVDVRTQRHGPVGLRCGQTVLVGGWVVEFCATSEESGVTGHEERGSRSV